jgi:hypothetical protein
MDIQPTPSDQITSVETTAALSIKDKASPLQTPAETTLTTSSARGWRFQLIIAALSLTGLLVALEASITSTALPTIVAELNSGRSYIWIVNSFLLGK